MCRIDRFLRDEHGSVTIEFVLWIPVILVLVAIVIDATTIYVTHTEMWNVARDTARRMVTGSIRSEEQAVDYATAHRTIRLERPYCVDANYDPANNMVEVVIGIRVENATALGIGSFLYQRVLRRGGDMLARVVMRPDPNMTDMFDDTPAGGQCGNSGGGGGGGKGKP